jgi:glycosyltransferase involved in cell wall biosynthesis
MSLVRRAWHAVPVSLRREMIHSGAAAFAPRRRPSCAGGVPVTIAGFLSEASGLGQGARAMADALSQAAIQTYPVDVTAALRGGHLSRVPLSYVGPGSLIVHVNAPMLPWALLMLGRRISAVQRVIGYWAWEIPVLPPEWDRGFRFVHEIWAPSAFSARAMRRPGGPAVHVVPYAVAAPSPTKLDRQGFGIPDGCFVVLTVFNAASSVDRKNPLAAVRAFRAAFGDDPMRLLVIKTMQTRDAGPAWDELCQAISGAGNIRLIDGVMELPELHALMASADCLLALHRSEGFGLPIAETMLLGKPVVATAWSGNMDFMTPLNSCPVGFRLVPVRDRQRMFEVQGAHWAEADIGEAAAALRDLANTPERCRALGAQALCDVTRHASPPGVAERVEALLQRGACVASA